MAAPATGLLLVISGPSGAGKTTIARQVEERLGGVFSISATTRPRAAGDVDGRDYWFITEDEFKRRIAAGEFLEHAVVFGRHSYGTPRQPVEQALAAGRLMILEIDVQGGLQVKAAMPEAMMIFVLPPNDAELMRRLRDRKRDSDEAIGRRFEEAQREIQTARAAGAYEAFIVNDDLERAVREACALVRARLVAGRPSTAAADRR
jgi:guanylate kinase